MYVSFVNQKGNIQNMFLSGFCIGALQIRILLLPLEKTGSGFPIAGTSIHTI